MSFYKEISWFSIWSKIIDNSTCRLCYRSLHNWHNKNTIVNKTFIKIPCWIGLCEIRKMGWVNTICPCIIRIITILYSIASSFFLNKKNHDAALSMWFSDSKEGDPSYHKVQNFNLLVQSVREIYIHRPHAHHSMSEV